CAPADGSPRRAAVNAFGIGGLNAHVVLDEYVPAKKSFSVASPGIAAGADSAVAPSTASPTTMSRGASQPEPIAIVAVGCRFAGAATLEAYAALLAERGDGTCAVPPDRWSIAALNGLVPDHILNESSAPFRGGFIKDFTYDWRL